MFNTSMLSGKELGRAIRIAIEKKGVSKAEVARRFGVKPPSVYGWMENGSISKDKVFDLFEYFSDVVPMSHWGFTEEDRQLWTLRAFRDVPTTTPNFIYPPTAPAGSAVKSWESPEDLDPETYVTVPHYKVQMSAGAGAEAEWVQHGDNDPLAFRARYFRAKGLQPHNCKAVYVRGESMEPVLQDGDTVLLDTSDTEIRDNQIYAVLYHGELYIGSLTGSPGRSHRNNKP